MIRIVGGDAEQLVGNGARSARTNASQILSRCVLDRVDQSPLVFLEKREIGCPGCVRWSLGSFRPPRCLELSRKVTGGARPESKQKPMACIGEVKHQLPWRVATGSYSTGRG
jgi:hypothetical protein